MTGFILAAGLGIRLKPLTDKIPKPALPFLNVPLILYSHYLLSQLGVRRIIVNTHHLPHKITHLFQQLKPGPVSMVFSDEQPDVLGTGGALKKARELIDKKQSLLLGNADSLFLDIDLDGTKKILESFSFDNGIATLLTIEHSDVGARFGGVWQNSKGEVLGMGKEKPAGTVKGSHYVGLLVLNPALIDTLPEGVSDLWKDGLNVALSRGQRVNNETIKAEWYETGDELSFLAATKIALQKISTADQSSFLYQVLSQYTENFKARSHPLKGLNTKIDSSALISESFMIGDRVHIEANSNLQGFGVVGEHCKIGRDCFIENAVILPNTNVKSGSVIRNTIFTG